MKRLRYIALACAVALTACMQATPYQNSTLTTRLAGTPGGLFVAQLKDRFGMPAPDYWRVTFEGTPETTDDTAQTYGLYRCATIALEQGFDGFEILSNVELNPEPKEYVEEPGFMLVPEQHRPFPVFSSEIRLLKGPIIPKPPKLLDARTVKAALEIYVTGKKCENGNVCPHDHDYLRPIPVETRPTNRGGI